MGLGFFPLKKKMGEEGESPFPSSFLMFTKLHCAQQCDCPAQCSQDGFYLPFENNIKIVSHQVLSKHFA